jgi:hypothetical protein
MIYVNGKVVSMRAVFSALVLAAVVKMNALARKLAQRVKPMEA